MNQKLWDYQLWLNIRRKEIGLQPIGVDGRFGTETRNATFETFRNTRAEAATPADLNWVASLLGGAAKQVAAVGIVEGGSRGWDDKGLLLCLYERHYMWKRLRVKIPFLSDPRPGGYTIDADKDGINDSWEKVADSCRHNPIAAFESASWGRFQIMGAHWKHLGYTSPYDFVWALTRSEAEHFKAMAAFVQKNGLTNAFRALSTDPETCRAFARGYNGSGYAKGNYHGKLAAAMR